MFFSVLEWRHPFADSDNQIGMSSDEDRPVWQTNDFVVISENLAHCKIDQFLEVVVVSKSSKFERAFVVRVPNDGFGRHWLQLWQEVLVGCHEEVQCDLVDVVDLTRVETSEEFLHDFRLDVLDNEHVGLLLLSADRWRQHGGEDFGPGDEDRLVDFEDLAVVGPLTCKSHKKFQYYFKLEEKSYAVFYLKIYNKNGLNYVPLFYFCTRNGPPQ